MRSSLFWTCLLWFSCQGVSLVSNHWITIKETELDESTRWESINGGLWQFCFTITSTADTNCRSYNFFYDNDQGWTVALLSQTKNFYNLQNENFMWNKNHKINPIKRKLGKRSRTETCQIDVSKGEIEIKLLVQPFATRICPWAGRVDVHVVIIGRNLRPSDNGQDSRGDPTVGSCALN